jgi:hypothetical protein
MSRVRDNLFTKVSSNVEEEENTGAVIEDAENVVISETEPENPTNSTIWLDTSSDSNILKIYDGTKWISVSGVWA